METIEEFEAFVRDRVVDLHMGLPQKISARKLSYAIGCHKIGNSILGADGGNSDRKAATRR